MACVYSFASTHLGGEAFDEDRYEEVEEDVVSERHQRDEVECGPGGRLRHPIVQHLVPVLLGQDLHSQHATTMNKQLCDHDEQTVVRPR